jgi:hypothetical protein
LQRLLLLLVGEQDLDRAMDGFLGERDHHPIRKLVALFLLGPLILPQLALVVIGGFDIVLFHALDDGSVIKLIFGVDCNFAAIWNLRTFW